MGIITGRFLKLQSGGMRRFAGVKKLSAAFSAGQFPWFVPPLLDDSMLEECEDNRSLIFIKQPNDVGDSHSAVQKEVADRDVSLG
jgi:hypothetical protein